MKITDPTEVCPECKKTYCKHYESDFDRFNGGIKPEIMLTKLQMI